MKSLRAVEYGSGVRVCVWLVWMVGWCAGWSSVRAGDGVIEGQVKLPAPAARAPVVAHYAHLPIQPGPPDPATAIVYLEGEFPQKIEGAIPLVYVLGQTNLQFTPMVLPVRKGSRVEFPNRDDVYHNVFSYSKPKRFDLGRYRRDERPAAQVFDQPGIVKLNCEIHEHMKATILVLDSPYFTRSATNGAFRLEGLPPGAFSLKAWINEKTVYELPVTLRAGETLRVTLPREGDAK